MEEIISTNKGILFEILELLLLILKILYYICESVYRLLVPRRKKSVTGEIVLITGAGHGVGRELAISYTSLGATVVCWDINEETNKQTLNDIKEMGGKSVYAYRCDVSNRNEVLKTAEKVKKEVGDVTILINNAAIIQLSSFQDNDANDISRNIGVNLMSHYWTLEAFLPSMIEKDHGHVVGISSLAALYGGAHGMVYCATKNAVRALMESLSEEMRMFSKGKSSIKFTTIYPSLIKTGFVKKMRIRFPILLGASSPQQVASLIIDAQRRNFREKSIPSFWLSLINLLRMLPDKAIFAIMDYTDVLFYE